MPSRRDRRVRPDADKEFPVKNRPLFLATVLGLAGASALSCASQSAATTGSTTEQQPAQAPATTAPVGPPQVAWADMTKPQRGQYMAAVVMPKMKALFRSFDEKEFAEMNC